MFDRLFVALYPVPVFSFFAIMKRFIQYHSFFRLSVSSPNRWISVFPIRLRRCFAVPLSQLYTWVRPVTRKWTITFMQSYWRGRFWREDQRIDWWVRRFFEGFFLADSDCSTQRKSFNDTCSVKRLYLRSIKTPRYPTSLPFIFRCRLEA